MDDDTELRLTALAYATRVMQDLQEHGASVPPIELRGGGWRPGKRENLFQYSLLPNEPALQFIDALGRQKDSDEHRGFVESLRRHPATRDRVDTQIGTAFSSKQVEAETIPEELMWAMPPGSSRLRADSFDAAFDELYQFLTREHEEYLVIAPLVNVELSACIVLRDGLEIDQMTDDEVVASLTARMITPLGSPGQTAWVHSRPALRIRDAIPVMVGEFAMDAAEADATYRRWITAIEDALHLMRLYKGGQVWARGAAVFSPRPSAYVEGYMALPIPHSTANASTGQYELAASDDPALRQLWEVAHSWRAVRSKPLETARRRFGFAGERIRAEDQLIDLVIAAEAIFLAGEQQESANKLALRSAWFLRGTAGKPAEIFYVMKKAYDARSKVAHGGSVANLKLPNGASATLEDYVGMVASYMRCTLMMLLEWAAKGEQLPMSRWDELILSALEPPDQASA